jgi:hypothetical protein
MVHPLKTDTTRKENHDLNATGPILIVDFLFSVVFGQQELTTMAAI